MPCDRVEAAKRKEFLEAARDVDRKLASGELKLRRTPTGAFEIVGFAETEAAKIGWADVCLLRKLATTGSLATRIALRNAGVKSINQLKVHSH